MFRSRLFRTFTYLAGMAGVIYVLISLFLPSSRRLILGVEKSSGRIRLVRSHVTFLPPHQFYRLAFDKREGSAQRDGLIRIYSKERVPVTINYRLRFDIAGEAIGDARTLVREGWSAWIRTRVGEAVSAVTEKVPIEELLSPTSQFAARRDLLTQTVAGHLARSGLKVSAFQIARIEADREALLAYKRAELRRGARGVAGRVAVFAIDGADWELISELADDGRVPNLRALAQGGTTATMQTIQPTVSPMLWTTVATGLPPDRHGVIDFLDRGRKAPVDSTSRRAPAIWEIAEAFGRHSMVVNWWGSWPPLSAGTAMYSVPVDHLRGSIEPAAFAPRIASLEVTPDSLGYQQVGRFLNITQREYDESVTGRDFNDPVNVFRNVLAKTWSEHQVAINLYRQQEPLLFLMHYEGTDVVNHLFAPYHPPYREGISQTNFRKYWPTVANYYAEVDRLLGEWMNILPDDTTVIVMSAHGFRWGKNRARVQPIGRSALSDHRNPGMFIAYGNHVAASRGSHSMSIYDVVPTVLGILGLPKSAEMPGQFASWALRDVQPVESVRVVSYSEFAGGRPAGSYKPIEPSRYTRMLQATGHLVDPSRGMQPVFDDDDDGPQTAQLPRPVSPEEQGAYAYYNNLGIELRKQNKLREAQEAFAAAVQRNPNRPAAYLNLAMTLFDRQQYTAADQVFLQAVSKGLPNADRWFVDFAALYRSRNMTSRAIQLLYQGRRIFPQSYLIAANLGSALAQADRYTEGLPELERALGLQPSSTLVLNNLGIYYSKQKDYGRALDFWHRSLTIDPRQPKIREAANAAQTQL